LTDETTRVLFILDALEPVGDGELLRAGEELGEALRVLSPDVRVVQRVIRASS
jgi:DNA/RNA-binding domain of Phe-tRNA-synthetase-like protein